MISSEFDKTEKDRRSIIIELAANVLGRLAFESA